MLSGMKASEEKGTSTPLSGSKMEYRQKAASLKQNPNEAHAGSKSLQSSLSKITWNDSPINGMVKLYVIANCCCAILILGFLVYLLPSYSTNTSSSAFKSHAARNAAPQDAPATSSTLIAPSATTVLNVFQVSGPVLGPSGIIGGRISSNGSTDGASTSSSPAVTSCQVTLMEFSFASSFGMPFVGNYTPPSCVDSADTVVMNFTVKSKGVQFDRLALMYLGDTEVFRTSTAEPKHNGIAWEYVKDMSEYMYFWKAPQKVIFDLANIVNANLTGSYNTTLTATFFSTPLTGRPRPADLIIPISRRLGINSSSSSVFSLPATNATNTISFPRNVNRAVFSLSSCGQATEEFWWSNVLQSDVDTFNATDGILAGLSPFREVQVYIDGQLAGIQWPFPVIFTGGVAPGLWSPIVGIDAFDLKESEIDVTPWLPLLCDGNQHTFSMKVAGLLDNGGTTASLSETVGGSWLLTGKVFVWLDSENSITTGSMLSISIPQPETSVSQSLIKDSIGANKTLTYTTSVQRILSISSTIKTQNGTQTSSWTQQLSHTDLGTWLAGGITQINQISTSGYDVSGGAVPYSSTYAYPLFANSTAVSTPDGNVSITALVTRSKNVTQTGASIHPSGLEAFMTLPRSASLVPNFSGTSLSTTQNGNATFFQSPSTNTSLSFGSTTQVFRFGGISPQGNMGMQQDTELYFRSVGAVNGSVVNDLERLAGAEIANFNAASKVLVVQDGQEVFMAPIR